jgi:hypothetical protein
VMIVGLGHQDERDKYDENQRRMFHGQVQE